MRVMSETTFALYFGNRGFFPEKLIAAARTELREAVENLGFGVLMMDAETTRHGAVETPEEGAKYARFLQERRGEFDGIILCLPNFGDENGAVTALRDADVPILIQAYPDELDSMDFEHRRDAFCGKFSIMDVFHQYSLPFTTFKPHAAHPASADFERHLRWFGAVCRIVHRLKRLTVGAIGARTTAFKTIRFDEVALQRYGVTTETLDLSEVFMRVRDLGTDDGNYAARAERLKNYTNWDGVPDRSFENLVKLGVVLDEIIDDYSLDALALRCWLEIEEELGVSPCVLLGDLNDRGIPAACELDVCNAVAMAGLAAASGRASTCLDWNNNYGDEADKCILFHCGPVPQSLMDGKGQIVDHPMFAKSLGAGCGFGCNQGRIAPTPMSFSSIKTEEGKISAYLGEGEFTEDPIPEEFFGCGGVAEITGLQDKLQRIGQNGYRHHVGVTPGHVAVPLREALERYLNYEITRL